MPNEELGLPPILYVAKKALRAKTHYYEGQWMGSEQVLEGFVSTNTATQSPPRTYAIEPTKMDEVRLVKELFSKAIASYEPHSATGTMMLPKIFGMTTQAKYVDQLKATNQQLEYRVGALESELRAFRPYMKTIQRMVDEYQAGTVRAQQILRDLRTNYQPSGAIARAAQRDIEVITEPIDWSAEETW
jgi:hypothetical protein